MDTHEVRALEEVLSSCASTEMVVVEGRSPVVRLTPSAAGPGTMDAPHRWGTNGNSRITYKETRQHSTGPVRREDPAYGFMRDGDEDGVVCE